MVRYLLGLGSGAGLLLLLGVAGDNMATMGQRIKGVEDRVTALKAQVDVAAARLTAVEARLGVLEKKAALPPGGSADAAAAAKPEMPAAPVDKPVAKGPEDLLAAYIAKQERDKIVRNLTSANYTEMENSSGVWATVEWSPGGLAGSRVHVVCKVRYIGEEDLKDSEASYQVVCKDKLDNTMAVSEGKIAGSELKGDKDYLLRQTLQLPADRGPVGKVELKIVRIEPKVKPGAPGAGR